MYISKFAPQVARKHRRATVVVAYLFNQRPALENVFENTKYGQIWRFDRLPAEILNDKIGIGVGVVSGKFFHGKGTGRVG